jgi:hypothetical protein
VPGCPRCTLRRGGAAAVLTAGALAVGLLLAAAPGALATTASSPTFVATTTSAAAPGESWAAELALDGGDDSGVVLSDGGVRLAPGAPGRPAEGVLTLAPRRLAAPAAGLAGVLTADLPAGTGVDVQARGLDRRGAWGDWRAVRAGSPARFANPTVDVQVRLLLHGAPDGTTTPVLREVWLTALATPTPVPPTTRPTTTRPTTTRPTTTRPTTTRPTTTTPTTTTPTTKPRPPKPTTTTTPPTRPPRPGPPTRPAPPTRPTLPSVPITRPTLTTPSPPKPAPPIIPTTTTTPPVPPPRPAVAQFSAFMRVEPTTTTAPPTTPTTTTAPTTEATTTTTTAPATTSGTTTATVPTTTKTPPTTTSTPGGTSAGRALWKAAVATVGLSGFKDTPYNVTGSSSVKVVDGPSKAIRFTVPSGSQRAEIEPDVPKLTEGQTRYFRLTYVLPPSFPTEPRGFQLATQWKNDGTGSPPLEVRVEKDHFVLGGGYGRPGGSRLFSTDIAPVITGRPVEIVVGIRFSSDPTKGQVDVWIDGQRTITGFRPPGGTLYPGLSSYWKVGLYRDTGNAGTASVDLLAAAMGTSYESVR